METFDGNPEFRYNRENRLKNAPDSVKDFYNGNMKLPPKGLFKVLFYTKTSRTMLVVLFFVVGVMMFISMFSNKTNIGKISNIKIELRGILLEDSIYTSVHFPQIDDKTPNSVEILFSAIDSNDTIINEEEIYAIYSGDDSYFRTFFNDYDIITVKATIKYNNETIELKDSIKK